MSFHLLGFGYSLCTITHFNDHHTSPSHICNKCSVDCSYKFKYFLKQISNCFVMF